MTGGRIRLGFVGAGFIAQVAHLAFFSRIPGVEIVSIADDRGELLHPVAEQYRIPYRLTSVGDLLAGPTIDAVVLSVARPIQSVFARQVIEAGLPMLVEKPAASRRDTAQRLADGAATRQLPVMVGYMRRHDPAVIMLRNRIAELNVEARLGSLLHVEMTDFCGDYGVPAPLHFRPNAVRSVRYKGDVDLPDGLPVELRADYLYTVNVGIHDVNLLSFLLSSPLKAEGFLFRPGGAQSALLSTPVCDVQLSLGPSRVGFWDQRITLYYRKGKLTLTLPSPMATQECGIAVEESANGRVELSVPPAQRYSAFQHQAESFCSLLRGRPIAVPGIQDAVADISLIEELWAMEGRK